MSLYHQLRESVEAVLDCARRMAEWSVTLLNHHWDVHYRDELRRLGRDLPHLIAKAIAAFHGDERSALDLKHELGCVEEEAVMMAEWAKNAADELQRLRVAVGTGDVSGSANLRYGQASHAFFEEVQTKRQVVGESCNRASIVAYRICTVAEALDQERAKQSQGPGVPDDQARGSGAELLDLLEISGTPKDKLRHGRELVQRDPDATAAQVIEAMQAAGVTAATIDKARRLISDLSKPLCLKAIADRLNNVAVFTDLDYRAKYLDSVPEWPLIRYTCERLFHQTGQVRSEDVLRLVDALRFEAGIKNAGEAPLTDIASQVQALLKGEIRDEGGSSMPSAAEQDKGTHEPHDQGGAPTDSVELTKVERAIQFYLRDPNQSVREVARKVPCDPSLLYRDERFNRLREAHQGKLPKGSKSGEGDLEAEG